MSIESEVAERVHRHIELHDHFTSGDATEMNRLISDDFEGWLYMPSTGKLERYDAERIRNGNRQAARHYEGTGVRFHLAGLTVLPQGPDQAAASYQVIFHQGETVVRALALEVWRKESDGQWRLIRWLEEKGPPIGNPNTRHGRFTAEA